MNYEDAFKALTGWPSFPWQRKLYDRFLRGDIPSACDIPTGLGKTSVIPVWLIALAETGVDCCPAVPRRLVYVVNRRTVVDQATRVVEDIRSRLLDPEDPKWSADAETLQVLKERLCGLSATEDGLPLAISTLRGEFADNGEWCADPARPAVIVGTVDMIGSRLLFSGYGLGFKRKPFHAGLLGQDALLIHDEAHLEEPFQTLITSIEKEQREGQMPDLFPLRVMALSATGRRAADSHGGGNSKPFELTDDEKNPPDTLPDPPTKPIHHVWRRIKARKAVAFHSVKSQADVHKAVLKLTTAYRNSNAAVLIFLGRVEDVTKVGAQLQKHTAQNVALLTGTIRGLERDALVKTPVFQRFLAESNRATDVAPAEGTVYLICTSAGEVGMDISGDHLVCDLTPFDSMVQRFGRVNRYGTGDARIDIVRLATLKDKDPYSAAQKKTLALLHRLPTLRGADDGKTQRRHDASPREIAELPLEARLDAFTPAPTIVPATDILFDAWALTTVTGALPGRPPVESYLHGIAQWEPPETHVAWREEVAIIKGDLLDAYKPGNLLDDYPLRPHELLRDTTDRVRQQLAKMAKHRPEQPVWVMDPHGDAKVNTVGELVERESERKNAGFKVDIAYCTVVLPPEAGGLHDGMLVGNRPPSDDKNEDVSGKWFDENRKPRRLRVWDDTPAPEGMRLIRVIDTKPEADENDASEDQPADRRFWYWYETPRGADNPEPKTAPKPVALDVHTGDVVRMAKKTADALRLPQDLSAALSAAAYLHDAGKRRVKWQRSIGNSDPTRWLAKSGSRRRLPELTGYRHEFGALFDAESASEFLTLDEDMKILVLHIIAAHHGRARPHFTADDAVDPEKAQALWDQAAAQAPRRFARLQRTYGRWGLAYLESLLRAADYAASAKPSKVLEEKEDRQ